MTSFTTVATTHDHSPLELPEEDEQPPEITSDDGVNKVVDCLEPSLRREETRRELLAALQVARPEVHQPEKFLDGLFTDEALLAPGQYAEQIRLFLGRVMECRDYEAVLRFCVRLGTIRNFRRASILLRNRTEAQLQKQRHQRALDPAGIDRR